MYSYKFCYPDPGSRIPDLGSWIPDPTHIFRQLIKKNFCNPCSNKEFTIFVKRVATKKGKTTNFFPSSFFVVLLVRDPGGKISGSGINIPDPQHWSSLF
jgi:hypothetical protein